MSLSLDELCQNGFHQGRSLSSSMCKEVRTKRVSNLSVSPGTEQRFIIPWYKYRERVSCTPSTQSSKGSRSDDLCHAANMLSQRWILPHAQGTELPPQLNPVCAPGAENILLSGEGR